MKQQNQQNVRKILREHGDGMTIAQLHEILGTRTDNIRTALKAMVDAYIDRWVFSYNKYAAVWCVVMPPEDCPKPEGKRK